MIINNAYGCFMGQMVGDALGAQFEFMGKNQINREHASHIVDGGTWNTIAGQATDDSELALMLADSIIKAGKYDQKTAFEKYYHWYSSHPFDCGGTTRQALYGGVMKIVRNEGTQANGALMRVSPLAIFGHDMSENVLADCAEQDAFITHGSKVCGDCNKIFVLAIAYAIKEKRTPEQVYQYAWDYAKDKENDIHKDVVDALRYAYAKKPENFHSGWVLTAFHFAFYYLVNGESFQDSLTSVVCEGGDTDTNGAITGALLGAVYGLDEIPGEWRSAVENCDPSFDNEKAYHPRPPEFHSKRVYEVVDGLLFVAMAAENYQD